MQSARPHAKIPTTSKYRIHRGTGFRPGLAFPRFVLALALAAVVALGASCGGDESETVAQDGSAATTAATDATPPAAAAEPAATSTAGSSEDAQTLSANDATIAELAAAFEAAGISNAQRWAREVDEYRPYDADDTDYAKLRRELAKYNPAPGVVDAIIAQLHLP